MGVFAVPIGSRFSRVFSRVFLTFFSHFSRIFLTRISRACLHGRHVAPMWDPF
jgi:hypothetical protein